MKNLNIYIIWFTSCSVFIHYLLIQTLKGMHFPPRCICVRSNFRLVEDFCSATDMLSTVAERHFRECVPWQHESRLVLVWCSGSLRERLQLPFWISVIERLSGLEWGGRLWGRPHLLLNLSYRILTNGFFAFFEQHLGSLWREAWSLQGQADSKGGHYWCSCEG